MIPPYDTIFIACQIADTPPCVYVFSISSILLYNWSDFWCGVLCEKQLDSVFMFQQYIIINKVLNIAWFSTISSTMFHLIPCNNLSFNFRIFSTMFHLIPLQLQVQNFNIFSKVDSPATMTSATSVFNPPYFSKNRCDNDIYIGYIILGKSWRFCCCCIFNSY